jgi:hypothetical protein
MLTGKLTCHNFLHLIVLCYFNFIGWPILCTKSLQVCTQVHIHMLCNHNKYVRKCGYKFNLLSMMSSVSVIWFLKESAIFIVCEARLFLIISIFVIDLELISTSSFKQFSTPLLLFEVFHTNFNVDIILLFFLV